MAKTLNALINEADAIIENRLSTQAEAPSSDILKLAAELREAGKDEPSSLSVDDYSILEKIAYARAIMDTVINLDYLNKVEEFEKRAKASGLSGDAVVSYFEKNASKKFRSVIDLLR